MLSSKLKNKYCIFLFSILTNITYKLNAQSKSFQSEDDVRIFMQDNWFSNPNGLKIRYGYISELNTYGRCKYRFRQII
jgi:hypothetical protein